jgi:predicted DCC family thiol-disulfide oxidoreductase YuxK
MLRRWDRKGRIRFTDIADPAFQPQSLGKTFDELMAQIYGRLPNGEFIKGVEVFRRLYGAVGFGPIVAISRWPGISHLRDLGYTLFAKNRLRLTGRCTAESCEIDRRPGR